MDVRIPPVVPPSLLSGDRYGNPPDLIGGGEGEYYVYGGERVKHYPSIPEAHVPHPQHVTGGRENQAGKDGAGRRIGQGTGTLPVPLGMNERHTTLVQCRREVSEKMCPGSNRIWRIPAFIAACVALVVSCDSPTDPPDVKLPHPILSIAASTGNTCAVAAGGQAFCWGDNSEGQLGNGRTRDSAVPVEVRGGIDFVQLTSGGSMRWPEYGGGPTPWAPFTCGLSRGGTAYCWGSSSYQSLGNGSIPCIECPMPKISEPTTVIGGPFQAISSGRGHTCAFGLDGQLHCWGEYAQVAPGPGPNQPAPLIGGPYSFSSFSVADDHACALDQAGKAYCWGENRWGQLGWPSDGLHPVEEAPVPVPGGTGFTRVYAGAGHTCGLKADGSASCWGRNDFGQLGTGNVNALCIEGLKNTRGCETDPTGPRPVAQGSIVFSSLALGQLHTCGVAQGGEVYCWGRGLAGQLGVPEDEVTSPTPVQTGIRFSSIAAGARHTCGISVDGKAYCWGWGQRGQLGNGQTRNSSVPVEVAGQSGPA